MGRTYRARNLSYGKATKLPEGWLKMELRATLRDLGGGVKVSSLALSVRSPTPRPRLMPWQPTFRPASRVRPSAQNRFKAN